MYGLFTCTLLFPLQLQDEGEDEDGLELGDGGQTDLEASACVLCSLLFYCHFAWGLGLELGDGGQTDLEASACSVWAFATLHAASRTTEECQPSRRALPQLLHVPSCSRPQDDYYEEAEEFGMEDDDDEAYLDGAHALLLGMF